VASYGASNAGEVTPATLLGGGEREVVTGVMTGGAHLSVREEREGCTASGLRQGGPGLVSSLGRISSPRSNLTFISSFPFSFSGFLI
jgi:hypothetical protein